MGYGIMMSFPAASDAIEKAIRGQTNVQAKYLGEIHLKNVDYGVRIYAFGDGR